MTVSTASPQPPVRPWIRLSAWFGVTLVAIAAVVVGVVLSQASAGAAHTEAAVPPPPQSATSSPSPSATVPPAPPKPTQAELTGVPLAFYDAVIGPLLDARSTISIVSASGEVMRSEAARLGTPNDPTPAATATYIESIYVDKALAFAQGNPIALTGAHSSTLTEYGGNSALTAIHYYPSTTGLSHGCVRVSAEMTNALAALPIGTPVIFS